MPYFPDLDTEVNTDPLAVGYSGMTDQQVADSLNAPTGVSAYDPIDAAILWNSILASEWNALNQNQQDRVSAILALSGELDVSPGTRAHNVIDSVFGGGSTTMGNLVAKASDAQSRAQNLGLRFVHFRLRTL